MNSSSMFSEAYAFQCDREDALAGFRNEFLFPQINGKDAVYLCGNSLGLQPKSTRTEIIQELDDWHHLGVEGHVHAQRPWVSYHEQFAPLLAPLVGEHESEVVAMNALTVNIHLLMVSFYKPTAKRFRIICEAKAFPSDQYALESQVKMHGMDPGEVIREIAPRDGVETIDIDDVLRAIAEEGDQLALVFIGGVNYYSGQVFDMERITTAAHAVGAVAGFDLAHAIGNVELKLHSWNVDFAAWCSYKYLNSGPGSVAGIFVHEKHCTRKDVFKLTGWWGHNKQRRFLMEPEFEPIPTAESWQMSNAPVLSMSAHLASLKVFERASMPRLIEKSKALTDYTTKLLMQVLENQAPSPLFKIITPNERGCQLSLLFFRNGKRVFEYLLEKGIIADWREPDVIRIAPVPLYNSFNDAFLFARALNDFQE
jgi:kynureninase